MKGGIVYIARAIDGSWVAPNPVLSQEEAQQVIEAHEPDPEKRSRYQILAESLDKLLADEIAGIKRGLQQRLVKWDGDAPGGIPEDASAHPENYPQVAEVIESGDDIPTRVVYRRS
jgi:hypothetical protein